MDVDNKENQCTICGEELNKKTEKSDFLCVDCADSWERETASEW